MCLVTTLTVFGAGENMKLSFNQCLHLTNYNSSCLYCLRRNLSLDHNGLSITIYFSICCSTALCKSVVILIWNSINNLFPFLFSLSPSLSVWCFLSRRPPCRFFAHASPRLRQFTWSQSSNSAHPSLYQALHPSLILSLSSLPFSFPFFTAL